MTLTLFGRALGLAFLMLAYAAPAALAQPFAPGAKVEDKAQNWPEKWEEGTFVRELPGGTQVVIREKPTQFFPEGFERAYSLNEVRALTPPPPVAQAPRAPVVAAPAVAPPRGQPAAPGAAPRGGNGLMSQQEILAFLRARMGDGDPFMNPQREAILAALRAEVMRRGVDFHYNAVSPFSNDLGRFGALSNVTYAIGSNFGPPAAQAELFGRWRLLKVGASRGSGFRGEWAGLSGAVTIGADGTYTWDSPSGMLRGRWRAATPAEMAMSDKGGQGVVLIAAKSGSDWIVFRRREEGPEGDGILVTGLQYRNLRERGTR